LAQPDIWIPRCAKLTRPHPIIAWLACMRGWMVNPPQTSQPTNMGIEKARPHVTSETMWRDMRLRAACMTPELRVESVLRNGVSSAFKKQGNAHSKTKHLVAMPCSCGVALVNMCNFCFTHNGLSRRLLANLRSRKVV